ncbi:MAG: YihA family ribosome biogenesis GTP-binding protein [Candidatus Liberibacter ctenarytainae]|uniref:Probable GTP-binding protein EngB n=1 Tax=Candidatus Liberibacter ctenarytainae TaxID=2020335 RepID=A0A937ARK7_9HYPH|nr:YihA family ribosome biogenesis GTP-binding protein [Candidatus Liberibacter ctenarytainae]
MINQKIFTKSLWIFLRGVQNIDLFPESGPPEIAFSGRSNVGKSSLINVLVNRKSLARTSNSPGRTQEINYFIPDGYSGHKENLPPMALVDMPGYGYAKAPKKNVDVWGKLVIRYLRERSTLRRLYLLIDCRLGIKKIDKDICFFLDNEAVSYQIILTKTDKISPIMAQEMLETTKKNLQGHSAAHPDIIPTSSTDRKGIEMLRKSILATVNY